MEEKDKSLLVYSGKTYRMVENTLSDGCDGCALEYNICGFICEDVYQGLDKPSFDIDHAIFIEVPETETENKETMKNDEIDYKALYEEEHKKYEYAVERAKGITSNMTTLQSIREHIFPELVESEEEKLSKKLHECVCRAINNDKLPYEERKYISEQVIPYLEKLEKQKEQKSAWSEEDGRRLDSIIAALMGCIVRFQNISNLETEDIVAQLQDDIAYFKSLEDRVVPQNQWKPTEEQMKALGDAIFDAEYDHRLTEMNALLSLDKDLKNL